jgi:hypothetical protein
VLLVFGAPCQLRLLAGQEHGRTIPLADIDRIEIPQRTHRCRPLRGWGYPISTRSQSGDFDDSNRVLGPRRSGSEWSGHQP